MPPARGDAPGQALPERGRRDAEAAPRISRRTLLQAAAVAMAGLNAPRAVGQPRSFEAARSRPRVPFSTPEALIRLPLAPHPRLLADAETIRTLPTRVRASPGHAAAAAGLLARADRLVAQGAPTSFPPYAFPNGVFHPPSRGTLVRVLTLALAHRLAPRRRYVDRVRAELETLVTTRSWLDTSFSDMRAELREPRDLLFASFLMNSAAIGLDWFYDDLPADERRALVSAITDKGLARAEEAYAGAPWAWWDRSTDANNWRSLCHGSIVLASLAVLDEAPTRAGPLLVASVGKLLASLRGFAPDGGWPEGVKYWGETTFGAILALSSLEYALGVDLGDIADGFPATAHYPLALAGPSGLPFHFADAPCVAYPLPQLWWLARRFDIPAAARYQARQLEREPHPLDVLWYDDASLRAPGEARAAVQCFRGAEVATLRSERGPEVFLATKAGGPANHAHLDRGTFVLDVEAVRFFEELGPCSYAVPGYWEAGPSGRRWSYYRTRAEGHNTLVIAPGEGPDQVPDASTVVRTTRAAPTPLVVLDLAPAYPGARQLRRGLRLRPGGALVQDEIVLDGPRDLWWFAHTCAEVELIGDGRSARLRRDGRELVVHLVEPAGTPFTVMPAAPLPTSPVPPVELRDDAFRKLAIHLPGVTELRIVVVLGGEAPAAEELVPLDAW